MFAKLFSLDTFLAGDLVRIFHLFGSALAVLVTAIGLMLGLAAMVHSPLIGLLTLLFAVALGGTLFLGVRLIAETVLAVARMHARFVGGRPGDPIPD